MNNIEIIEPSRTSEIDCFNNANCHKLSLNRKTGLIKLEDLTLSQLELLKYRSGLETKINSEVIYLQSTSTLTASILNFKNFAVTNFESIQYM